MIRLGLIGCGGVAESRHLPALRRVRGVRVAALADVDPSRLERVARRFGAARRYENYSDLIEGGDVDAVAVCVPPTLHADAARAALDAGKHVFIEKPLALGLAECDRLIEAAEARRALKVTVGFNLRAHRLVRAAREIVGRGELGEVKLVGTTFTSGARLGEGFADWRTRRESGGGALFEQGSHHFDLLRFLLGREAEEVSAASGRADETATFMARMEGGAQVVSAFSEGTAESHAVEVYGARGRLRVSLYRADGLEQFRVGEYAGAPRVRLREAVRTLRALPRVMQRSARGGDQLESYAEEWRQFVGAITRDAPVACTLRDGRRALEIALAAWESSATRRAVRLDDTKAEEFCQQWTAKHQETQA
ncbi:MAG: Gfo/Idh/MocA family oxidoreductase [Acidobacteria bacterium]|nr:Gfo/Idh/MocA family oxidoreductase [Acidobacteriota bacterium]